MKDDAATSTTNRHVGVHLDDEAKRNIVVIAQKLGLREKVSRSPAIRRALAWYARHLEKGPTQDLDLSGANLRRLRLAEGLERPKDLAVLCGVDRTSINHAEDERSVIQPGGPIARWMTWASIPCTCDDRFCLKHPKRRTTEET